MRIETPRSDLENCPPGLLIVADTLSRVTDRKRDLLEYEIERREREHAIMHETIHALSWHPFHTTKTVILYGVHGFILAWVLGSLGALGRAYSAMKATEVTIPLPVVKDFVFNLGSYIPTSTSFALASRLPAITFRNALFIGAAVAVIVILEKVVTALFEWKKVRSLKAGVADLEKEITTLKEWRKALGR